MSVSGYVFVKRRVGIEISPSERGVRDNRRVNGWRTAYAGFEPRNVPVRPMTVATMPPMSIQMALSVGEPVKNRDTSELKEFVALMPMIMSAIPPTSRARETILFIIAFQ